MAASEAWWSELEARLYTKFRARLLKREFSFGEVNVTREGEQKIPSRFPTVYFHEADQRAYGLGGYSLEDAGINGVTEYIEVAIIHNGTESELRELAVAAEMEMQKMGFRRSGGRSPVSYEGENIIRCVERFRRVTGAGDTIT